MNKFFRKHKTVLFVALAIIFVCLPFFGVGTNYLLSSPQDVVVKVNGEGIKRGQYDRLLNQLLRTDKELTPAQKQEAHSRALNELIRMTVYDQEAKRYGLFVPDQELKLTLEHTPAFQKDGHFDPNLYVKTLLQAADTTPEEFELFRKKDMAANKLNQLFASAIHISDADLQTAGQARLALETDPKKRKELQADPEKLRDELWKEEFNWVMQDWLGQINSQLKVNFVSERFRKSLSGAVQ